MQCTNSTQEVCSTDATDRPCPRARTARVLQAAWGRSLGAQVQAWRLDLTPKRCPSRRFRRCPEALPHDRPHTAQSPERCRDARRFIRRDLE